jgi:transcription termination factor Rho
MTETKNERIIEAIPKSDHIDQSLEPVERVIQESYHHNDMEMVPLEDTPKKPASRVVRHPRSGGSSPQIQKNPQEQLPPQPQQQSRPVQQQQQQRKSVPQQNTVPLYVPLEKRTLSELSVTDLNVLARRYGIIGAGLLPKDQLIEKIKFAQDNPDVEMFVEGVLEKLPDGFGFLRSPKYDYVSGPDDVYVSPSQIRRFALRTGDTVTGVIRKPKEGEKYFALLKVNKINGHDPLEMADRPHFERLNPVHPYAKFNLEYDAGSMSTRIMDLFTPLGRGQRGLIVAPPKVGKTLLLKDLTQSLIANHPEANLIILLIDERPEEVADMKRAVKGTAAEVISSTFDEPAERHVQVAELVLEKAKRMVESGKDVIILLDSMTRLARAYNTTAPASGKILTGGIDANALQWPKRFFGAARATEEGGSLTIIASVLVETGSRMDDVIYEEFKGTGNMEMHMTRKLSNRRTYPAFDLLVSGTRREDLLHTPDDLNKVWVLQKFLSTMNTIEGMEFLIDKMRKHKTNQEFLESINKKPNGGS